MVQVVGGWRMDFWDPWCQDAMGVAVAGRIDFVAEVMVDDGWECGIVVEVVVVVGDDEGYDCVALVGVDVRLMLHLIERMLLPLFLLAKNVDVVL
jgi:hypothetical protein